MFQDRSLIAPAVFLRLQIVGRIFHKAREHLINRELLSCRGGLALFTRTAWPSRYCPGLVHVPRALGAARPREPGSVGGGRRTGPGALWAGAAGPRGSPTSPSAAGDLPPPPLRALSAPSLSSTSPPAPAPPLSFSALRASSPLSPRARPTSPAARPGTLPGVRVGSAGAPRAAGGTGGLRARPQQVGGGEAGPRAEAAGAPGGPQEAERAEASSFRIPLRNRSACLRSLGAREPGNKPARLSPARAVLFPEETTTNDRALGRPAGLSVFHPRRNGLGSCKPWSQFQAPGGANSCPLRWTLRRAGVRAGRAVPSGTLVQDFSSLCKPHADKTSVLAAVGREQGTWLPGTPTQATMALPARDEAGRVRSVLPARRQF
ncbi:unnamed protein product [Rangifer tarandus platyrhynchus]|uniref:Uncharacterized protein n=1 Tax=Rangifer tarandus platyrhynchus TaxID=3082113 RepID=A0ABN9A533_RANTA|nr:unnamed protein product [Rangifer tarandus platyrhynchus]